MKVIVMRPERDPEVKDIKGDLTSFQLAVEGYIEQAGALTISGEKMVVLYCNEDGKLKGLPYNYTRRDGELIVGPVLAVKVDDHGREVGLTVTEAAEVMMHLKSMRGSCTASLD